MSKEQRDYMLRQQMQAIQEELGETNPEKAEVEELRHRLAEADLPDEVRKEAERELTRLERLPPAAPDYPGDPHLPRLDPGAALAEVDRGRPSTCKAARQVLDEDHYDLEEIKERILEHLAVLKLNPEGEGADPVPGRPARRRQDVAGPVDRPRAGPQVRAPEPGRPARRGGAARPSAHATSAPCPAASSRPFAGPASTIRC